MGSCKNNLEGSAVDEERQTQLARHSGGDAEDWAPLGDT
jgi:hypothetical protein